MILISMRFNVSLLEDFFPRFTIEPIPAGARTLPKTSDLQEGDEQSVKDRMGIKGCNEEFNTPNLQQEVDKSTEVNQASPDAKEGMAYTGESNVTSLKEVIVVEELVIYASNQEVRDVAKLDFEDLKSISLEGIALEDIDSFGKVTVTPIKEKLVEEEPLVNESKQEKATEEQRKQLKRVYAAQLLHLQEITNILAMELILAEVKEIARTNKSRGEEILGMVIFKVYILCLQKKHKRKRRSEEGGKG